MQSAARNEGRIDPFALRQLGRSDLQVPVLGFGAGTLGDPTEVISDEQAEATVDLAFDSGVRFFDTAPWYGLTKSERRLGAALSKRNRDAYLVNTKVGRLMVPSEDPDGLRRNRWAGGLDFDVLFDYTAEGFERSYRDSLDRMSMDRVDALAIHDLDFKFHHTEEAVDSCLDQLDRGGGFEWLLEKKRNGEIQAIGAGLNQMEMIPKFLDRFDGLDYFLVAMPYTLLYQPMMDGGFARCRDAGVSCIIGAVFASGILALGTKVASTYGYAPTTEEVLAKVRRIENECERFGVPLGAAALQFPLGHPQVDCVIPGGNSPEIVAQNLDWMRFEIPQEFWMALKKAGLLREDVPTP
ncbi:MAG: aldo/keto reductase [Verrucomicrobiota bacterium]